MIKVNNPFDKLILKIILEHYTVGWLLFMEELQRQPKMNRYLAIIDGIRFEMLLDLVKRVEKLLKWSFKLRIMDLEDFNTLPSHVS